MPLLPRSSAKLEQHTDLRQSACFAKKIKVSLSNQGRDTVHSVVRACAMKQKRTLTLGKTEPALKPPNDAVDTSLASSTNGTARDRMKKQIYNF